MRWIGLDVHRDFCEVAIASEEAVRSAGRIPTRVASLELFAQSLAASDVVAIEAPTGADTIVSLLQAHGLRVVVANTRKLKGISDARAKTDRLDARLIARMLRSGLLDEVWTPDEGTRTLLRLTNPARAARAPPTRTKNEAHGVLARNLCDRPPVTDTFGKAGRRWLAGLELPVDERLTLDGRLRQVDFLDAELAALDSEIAKQARAWPEVLRLMTVPGVNVQTAATFMAAIGDIRRFSSPRKLVRYLGLDPRVRQSGSTSARHGCISKAGASEPRHMLGEVAWKVTLIPGPLRAFFERIRARRGPQIAATTTARKLAALFLAPAHPRRGLRLRPPSNDPQQDPPPRATRRRAAAEGAQGHRRRQVESRLRRRARALTPAEAAYRRLVSDWRSSGPPRAGAGATPGRASSGPSKGKAARQTP